MLTLLVPSFPQPVFEDSMDLIAKLPVVASIIYNNLYRDGAAPASIDTAKDWSHNFTQMIGYEDPMFTELMRLYLTIHRYGRVQREREKRPVSKTNHQTSNFDCEPER